MKNELIIFAFVFAQPSLAMEEWELANSTSSDDSLFESPIPEEKDLTPEERTIRKKLRYAIRTGHKAHIAQYLANGGDPDKKADTFNNYTLLMYACEKDQPEIVGLLIQYRADVNARSPWGEATPILCADPNLRLYEKLVAAGADVNARCCDGYSALILAAQDGDLDSCEFLIAHGASLHTASYANGTTALITAASVNNEEKCKLIVERQKKYNQGIIWGLWYLKTLGNQNCYLKFLYAERDRLLKPYLEKYSLQALLRAKGSPGNCAYDLMKVDWLKPRGYEKKEGDK